MMRAPLTFVGLRGGAGLVPDADDPACPPAPLVRQLDPERLVAAVDTLRELALLNRV